MSTLSTHVLDTAKGKPAAGVPVILEHSGLRIGSGVTDADGRLRFTDHQLVAGEYRITFETAVYFGDQPAFYPSVSVLFSIQDPTAHYHVPLLLSPYGYSTYRGS